MQPIPLPSHIHYELLLQLLERQTSHAVRANAIEYEQVNQLIATLRKALTLQKRLENDCDRHGISFEYRWSLNENDADAPPRYHS
ncbi:MAG: DUF5340 domain-containing protein [Coleofasciculaceae cyanobacterium RL_1_1]|jgi:hypothetical protein|nr:DUF5340 domain-containing protein [Coleofasciculaceae cyanobacterium RL_1_1]